MSLFNPIERDESIIKFECPRCSREFHTSQDQAGQRVSCPACHSIFRVPRNSIDIVKSIGDSIFDNAQMNELYLSFLEQHEDRVKSQRTLESINGGNTLLLEVETDTVRTQLVILSVFETDADSFAFIQSTVGEIYDEDQYFHALRASHETFNLFSLSLDEDHMLIVRSIRKLKNYDSEEFNLNVLGLANFADTLEENLIGSDHH